MKSCSNHFDVAVKTIKDITIDELEYPEWIIETFISWADIYAHHF
jgi:hypothetical protein